MAMKDLGDEQRRKARELMPEVARIVQPYQPKMGEKRSMVTAPNTIRNFAKGGAVKHDDAKQDKRMIKQMVKPQALKKADGGAIQRANARPGTSAGTKVERMATGGAAARAQAPRGTSAGTKVEKMNKGGRCR